VDASPYIGSGKAEELALTASACEADIFVFDDELSAIQLRNLEHILGLPIIDRTMLILDIFAQRAQSREGKLQVELAQLKYRLPRLLGMGRVLSRQGASGRRHARTGEKKLEIDRRRIRRRVFELEQELGEIEKQRGLRRSRRTANPIPVVALVGYTNAGKSTLLNLLSGSDALAEDKLFATLDPIVRKITLPNGTECLVSDTVGFINKLPHDLVNAFQSTLDEVCEADLILHVVDSASDYYEVQMHVVEDVLGTLGALDTPRIEVYNKTDKQDAKPRPGGIGISAANGTGIDELLLAIQDALSKTQVKIDIVVPYDRYDAMRLIRQTGTILSESHEEDGTHVAVLLNESELWRVKKALREPSCGFRVPGFERVPALCGR
jgi:GTP-binding protein HflX